MTLLKERFRSSKWEYAIPSMFSFLLILLCILTSQRKYFWNDELLSLYLINDRSFSHMMAALSDTINNAPPLYFVLGWIWSKAFTSSELSLRLFSCLGICLSQTIVWLTLRSPYGFWPASFGTVIGFLSSALITQNSEARFYGLFMAACSLGLLQFVILCKRGQYSNQTLLANILTHIIIIQIHIYGFIYSGIILFALMVRDRYFNVFRLRVYGSFILAWLSFIPFIPSFLRQAELGKPHSWIPVPDLKTLIVVYYDLLFCPKPRAVFLLLLIGILLTKILVSYSKKRRFQDYSLNQENLDFDFRKIENLATTNTSLLILAGCLLIVPILTWLISHTMQSIFLERYMLPTQIGWSILLTSLIHYSTLSIPLLDQTHSRSSRFKALLGRKRNLILAILISIIISSPIYSIPSAERLPGSNDSKYGQSDLPIVVESSHIFLRRFHYSPQSHRYFFILDSQLAFEKTRGLFSIGEYKTMDALKRNYSDVFRGNIIQNQDFLNIYDRFFVLNVESDHYPKWYEKVIKASPGYNVKRLGMIEEGISLLFVEKSGTGSA